MAKKDISKVISSGSPKQRIKLFVEHMALERYGHKGLITEREAKALFDSFKTEYDIKLYNKWQKIDKTVTVAITNLQGLKFQTLMHNSDLRGYILVWHTMEEAELLTNSILHEVEEDERKRIAEKGAKEVKIMFSQLDVDEEGYLDLKVDFEKDTYKGKSLKEKPVKSKAFSLWYVMNNVRKEAEESFIQFISWRQAILDYMEEEGFTVKIYREQIKQMTEDVYRPVIGWDKYLEGEKHFMQIKKGRLDKLKPFYNVAPDLNKIEIDKDIYDTYMKEYLR